MKKIKSIKQLQAEKRRINERLDYLENKMHDHWTELKYRLKPASLIKDSFISVLNNKRENGFSGESLLKGTLAFGVSLLVNRFAKKAGEKFKGICKKKKKQQEPAN